MSRHNTLNPHDPDVNSQDESRSRRQAVAEYLERHPEASILEIIAELAEDDE